MSFEKTSFFRKSGPFERNGRSFLAGLGETQS